MGPTGRRHTRPLTGPPRRRGEVGPGELDEATRVATVGKPREVGPHYPWFLLGLLWFCGFFNYADRLAVNAVFEQIKGEFHVSDTELGLLGMAFMVVYAVASPF